MDPNTQDNVDSPDSSVANSIFSNLSDIFRSLTPVLVVAAGGAVGPTGQPVNTAYQLQQQKQQQTTLLILGAVVIGAIFLIKR